MRTSSALLILALGLAAWGCRGKRAPASGDPTTTNAEGVVIVPSSVDDSVAPCIQGAIGDRSSCKSNDTLADEATTLCASRELKVLDVATEGACDAGAGRAARYLCCPTACRQHVAGGPACLPDREIDQQAREDCTREERRLTVLRPDDLCGAGVSRYVTFVCCP